MRLTALHRWLVAGSRALFVVLLAFAIEIVLPQSALVQHRHAHGRATHVQGDRIDGTQPVARSVDGGDTAHAGGLYAATAADLHRHFASPTVVASLPAIAPIVPRGVVVPLPLRVVVDVVTVTIQPGQLGTPSLPDA